MTIFSFFVLLLAASGCQPDVIDDTTDPGPPKKSEVQLWLSNPDKSALFELQDGGLSIGREDSPNPTITINPEVTYQEIDGFGYTLTGGSALHINNMSASAREDLLEELFAWDEENIGVSYLRVSIGASDLDPYPFSYNDLSSGETDPELTKFTLAEDKKNLIPVLKEIIAIYPDIKIMGSPWSPPKWMKTNNHTIGGSLKPEYYNSYAQYFVKYIKGMAAEGITIDAITVQNEPLHPGNNPSLLMLAEDQAEFVKNHLGPAFEAAGIDTKIIIYDHNADRPDYPISILNDPEAKKYIDGSAFHLYGGDISALSQVHAAHPDKNLYFTEQWIGAPGNFANDLSWHIRELIIGATRNWSRNVLEWNLAADANQDPHTEGGCYQCLGALTITGNSVQRNPAYYIIAHASKFVRPGSRRVESNTSSDLPNVAFKTPEGNTVLVVLNNTQSEKAFNIRVNDEIVVTSLNGGAVGTFVW